MNVATFVTADTLAGMASAIRTLQVRQARTDTKVNVLLALTLIVVAGIFSLVGVVIKGG